MPKNSTVTPTPTSTPTSTGPTPTSTGAPPTGVFPTSTVAPPTSTGATPTSTSNPSPVIDPLHPKYKAVGVEYTQDGVTKTAYLKSLTLPSMSKMGIDFSKVGGSPVYSFTLIHFYTPLYTITSSTYISPSQHILSTGAECNTDRRRPPNSEDPDEQWNRTQRCAAESR